LGVSCLGADREIVTERTFSALESRANEGKSAGGKAYGYDGREINKAQAASGSSSGASLAQGCKAIAVELNADNVASPAGILRQGRRATSRTPSRSTRDR
jgi:DNA invertase Pin-like site-specific DNA recombinase